MWANGHFSIVLDSSTNYLCPNAQTPKCPNAHKLIYIHKVKSPKMVRQLPCKYFGKLEKNEHLRPTHLLFKIPAKIAKK